MNARRYFCGMRGREAKSAEVEPDIYPVHILDDAKCLRACPSYLFHFNDVLDAEKLSDSLSRLLEIGDWRKLGGRFRRKANGRLEIVVPKQFSVEQPALSFTQDAFDTGIAEHPLGCSLAKAAKGSSVHPLHSEMRTFAGPSGSRTINTIIQEQTPLLSLHVTSFTNATIVVFSWPHPLMDAMGTRALLHNWSLVLNGREEQVSAVASARQDFVETELEGKVLGEELIIDRKQLPFPRLLVFALRIFFQNIFGPGFEERTMLLEKKDFEKLKSRAQTEQTPAVGSESEAPKHSYISDGDVLAAWAAQTMALSEPRLRSIAFFSIINARFRLPALQRNPAEEYIQNLLSTAYFNISPAVGRGSLGPIALAHRQNVSEQSTEQQTWSFLKMQREHLKTNNDYKHNFGDPHGTPIVFNNLSKGEILHAVDFHSAVVEQGEEGDDSRGNPMGTAVYFTPLATRMVNRFFKSNHFHVLGKDHAGNYRVTALLRPRMWARIEEELKAL